MVSGLIVNISLLCSLATEMTGLTVYAVDTELQDQFFVEVHKQLRKVESFFKGMIMNVIVAMKQFSTTT